MAGRINEEDIALVRERARIDEVVRDYVQLRNAGGGSLKGLCPFHDERTPSFQVTPSRGLFYCFGCQTGGDTITFLQLIENLTFVEAVQRLADRTGVQLRIIDDGTPSTPPGMRTQILAANDAAAEFFRRQMLSDEGAIARDFVTGRGFTREHAEYFGMGYAPKGGHVLRDHLLAQGFTPQVLVTAGLVRDSGWDFFQGRVLWPIKDSAASVLGFGARRVWDDDRMPAKYVNTPETPVYKKSHVLYGLDLARTNIGKKNQVVVVEGYTDVMAMHVAGIDTAVASCGTAFGPEHAHLVQRLMGNRGALNGEVIFTFDGDAAGRSAALKAYRDDEEFTSQTYVAVEPNGLDPCDLRMQEGDAAVRELVARRVPLYRFVMENTVDRFDLDRADGRLAAARAAAPLVTSIRDAALVSEFTRELAQIIGMDVDDVRREVVAARRHPHGGSPGGAPANPRGSAGHYGTTRGEGTHGYGTYQGQAPTGLHGGAQRHPDGDVSPIASRGGGAPALRVIDGQGAGAPTGSPVSPRTVDSDESLVEATGAGESVPSTPWPDPRDPKLMAERGLLKLMLQYPQLFDAQWALVEPEDFRHPTYRTVFDLVRTTQPGDGWQQRIQEATHDDVVKQLVVALLVEAVLHDDPTASYARAYAARVRLLSVVDDIANLKSRLQRTNPQQDPKAYNAMFADLVTLESLRKELIAAQAAAPWNED